MGKSLLLCLGLCLALFATTSYAVNAVGDCTDNRCSTDGTARCQPTPSHGHNYTCDCYWGYGGDLCDRSGSCVDNLCEHGVCAYFPADYPPFLNYTCRCEQGWGGVLCNKYVCGDFDCNGRGTCQAVNQTNPAPECECDNGWAGEHCEKDLCGPLKCVQGSCVTDGETATCQCEDGWIGDDCSTDLCKVNPCGQFGACERIHNNFTCVCLSGYSGSNCQDKADAAPEYQTELPLMLKGNFVGRRTGFTYLQSSVFRVGNDGSMASYSDGMLFAPSTTDDLIPSCPDGMWCSCIPLSPGSCIGSLETVNDTATLGTSPFVYSSDEVLDFDLDENITIWTRWSHTQGDSYWRGDYHFVRFGGILYATTSQQSPSCLSTAFDRSFPCFGGGSEMLELWPAYEPGLSNATVAEANVTRSGDWHCFDKQTPVPQNVSSESGVPCYCRSGMRRHILEVLSDQSINLNGAQWELYRTAVSYWSGAFSDRDCNWESDPFVGSAGFYALVVGAGVMSILVLSLIYRRASRDSKRASDYHSVV